MESGRGKEQVRERGRRWEREGRGEAGKGGDWEKRGGKDVREIKIWNRHLEDEGFSKGQQTNLLPVKMEE